MYLVTSAHTKNQAVKRTSSILHSWFSKAYPTLKITFFHEPQANQGLNCRYVQSTQLTSFNRFWHHANLYAAPAYRGDHLDRCFTDCSLLKCTKCELSKSNSSELKKSEPKWRKAGEQDYCVVMWSLDKWRGRLERNEPGKGRRERNKSLLLKQYL